MIMKHEIYLDGFLRKEGVKTNEKYCVRDFLLPRAQTTSKKYNTQMTNYIKNVFNGDEKSAIDYMNDAKRFMNTQDFFYDL